MKPERQVLEGPPLTERRYRLFGLEPPPGKRGAPGWCLFLFLVILALAVIAAVWGILGEPVQAQGRTWYPIDEIQVIPENWAGPIGKAFREKCVRSQGCVVTTTIYRDGAPLYIRAQCMAVREMGET